MARRLKTTDSDGRASVPWWQRRPRRRYGIVGTVDAVDVVPAKLPHNGMVVVNNGGSSSWAAFDCPCSLGHRLLVPLHESMRPHWRLTGLLHPSLYPSVDVTEDSRRCHFWLRAGRVRWAANSTSARSR
jgi:hypothetical protein